MRRIRVTPEIAARIRRGEDVSPDEIARASAEMDERERRGAVEETTPTPSAKQEKKARQAEAAPEEPVNEWLPEAVTGPKKRAKGKKR